MPYELSKLLVIGVSSSALFDLKEEANIYSKHGLQAFIDFQRTHEDVILQPGAGFPLVRGLLNLNRDPENRKVEVILMSQNHPDVSMRIWNSIRHYELDITRAALTGGEQLSPYLAEFNTGLFLSQDREDVQLAANQGFAAALIYAPPVGMQTAPSQIRIAFDGDCVLFSDESQRIFEKENIAAFRKHEQENAKKQLPDGPFAPLLRTLSQIQGDDPTRSPIRIGLFTDRNGPAHERVLRTFRAWNVRIDSTFFLGAITKAGFVKAFGAHMFFDDKEEYCRVAAKAVPTGHVLVPVCADIEEEPSEIDTVVHLQNVQEPNGEERFLLICRHYFKRDFPGHESDLKEWYQVRVTGWPEAERNSFLTEFETSVKGTPAGNQRRAVGPRDTPKQKLLLFLDSLSAKHQPK